MNVSFEDYRNSFDFSIDAVECHDYGTEGMKLFVSSIYFTHVIGVERIDFNEYKVLYLIDATVRETTLENIEKVFKAKYEQYLNNEEPDPGCDTK